jgi:hypothetical protein
MPGAKLKIWNQRMLLLMEQQIAAGETQYEFLQGIDFAPTNIRIVRMGKRGFTVEQIYTACKKYNVNPSWILGMSSEMKLRNSKTALQQLDDAVISVKAELQERRKK